MHAYFRDNGRFIKDNGRWLGGGFLLMMFSFFGQTYFVGLTGEDLRAHFGLSAGQFGGFYMIATLLSSATLPWLGRTLDLMPGWKVARFTIPGLAAACVLLAFAPNLVVLVLALYLLRLFGQGMMTEIAYTETGRWFVADRGRAMALVVLGLQGGAALIPLVAVYLERTGGWRLPWLGAAGLLALVAFPAILKLLSVERVPRAREHHAKNAQRVRHWTRREVLRDPILYLILAGTLAPAFIGTTIFFYQGYLMDLRGYDPLVFAAAYPIMALTTIVFGLLCGHLVDRLGALRLLPFVLIPVTLSSLVIGLVAPVWGIYLFMFLAGVGNGFSQTLLGALWPEVYGLANLGGIRAIVVSAMVLSSALGPSICGFFIDIGVALPRQMLWMAGWCVLASFGLLMASRAARSRQWTSVQPQADGL
ncbi:MAG TPA: MFS transporter [Gammaproteobacteria bacterium]|nr:MFS transporter [Gammaproteobacteria bacterium]